MYNPTVKKGNWLQKLELGKEKVASFLEKREKGELLVQQTRNMFHNLLQKTRLSEDIDGFVKFGSCIQLKAPDMPNSPPPTSSIATEDDKNGYGVVMTATIHDKHISKVSNLTNDCNLVASPLLTPCMRNSFVIKSADKCNRDGENLLFGQEFLMQVLTQLNKNNNILLFGDYLFIESTIV
ncbi:cilia- and flagella-associated protein 161 [Venturia canescens]|uniref:cilia- and flagella-associated protein 161 n=1 Tax=Venturia canescens TaxID=32260 RepID=UPI001C9C1F9E|nr:cilia- and flagella-associated protein 161 [Venturia canescens]